MAVSSSYYRKVIDDMNNTYLDFSGKSCIITGGAQGIGKTVAEYLADAGANIAIWDLGIERAKETAKSIKEKYNVLCKAYDCNVTDYECVDSVLKEVIKDFNQIDALFNNAGICIHKAAKDLEPNEWLNIIDVNLNGVFWVARAVGKYFIENNIKGSIVNTASMSGHIVNIPQKQASYNASKAAVIHLTKSLAVEWAEYGVRVNCISPGYIFTEMTSHLDEKLLSSWIGTIPYRRMGKPDELAGAVLYLMSDMSTYTSGCDMVIDGCFTCV